MVIKNPESRLSPKFGMTHVCRRHVQAVPVCRRRIAELVVQVKPHLLTLLQHDRRAEEVAVVTDGLGRHAWIKFARSVLQSQIDHIAGEGFGNQNGRLRKTLSGKEQKYSKRNFI